MTTHIRNTDLAWIDVGSLDAIAQRGSRRVMTDLGVVAVFRTGDDRVFALLDQCPHKKGPLSEGIVHGASVTCPLHGFVIDLASGEPTGADAGKGCTPTLPVRVTAAGRIELARPVVIREADAA